eukprot:Tbor_TRINITY_DN5407_c0_g3::TRINITY_DN5407_c0_g3_i1::g.24847::m.24847
MGCTNSKEDTKNPLSMNATEEGLTGEIDLENLENLSDEEVAKRKFNSLSEKEKETTLAKMDEYASRNGTPSVSPRIAISPETGLPLSGYMKNSSASPVGAYTADTRE